MTWFPSIASLSGQAEPSPWVLLLTEEAASWGTAVQYQLVHSLALLFVSTTGPLTGANLVASYAFATGITLFSGSIYGLCLAPPGASVRKLLGPTTPLGGLAFIVGWLALAYARRPSAPRL